MHTGSFGMPSRCPGSKGYPMDERSLHVLEFYRILEILSGFCRAEAGKKAALELRPFCDVQQIKTRQHLYEETRSWMAECGGDPVPEFSDLSGILAYLETHTAPDVDAESLWVLRDVLILMRKLSLSIHEGAERRPVLDSLALSQPLPERSISALSRCVGDNGTLRDESSPGLLLVRGELRGIHQSCLRKVREFAERYNIAHYLRDEYMTLSSDRYVLPLKANFKGRLQGIVHDYSHTGETLYFEPLFLVEQNNRLCELKRQEREEERKVLRMLADLLIQELPQIRAGWNFLVQLDLCRAVCAMGDAFEGHWAEIDDDSPVSMPQARHPLLALQAVMAARAKDSKISVRRARPVDIVFRKGDRALVISGGNAGGKTVALKTLGLNALMTLAGLPVPAAMGSHIPLWESILAFIGDEQSLDDHVSTFTGQILHLSRAWDGLNGKSLVLLDEFGAGTDPAQGAALAQAVLDGLLDKQCLIATATHFPALKSYALTKPGVRAASMLFDPGTKKPLYRIAYDQVGASQALDVAREHGLPESVLAGAQRYLLMDAGDASHVMDRLNMLAAQREEELEKLREQESQLRRKYAALQEKTERSRRVLEEDMRRMSQELMHDYRAGKATARQAHKELARLRAQIAAEADNAEKQERSAESFTVGGEVTHALWGKRAVVRQIDEKSNKVKIDMGGVTLWAPAADLTPGKGTGPSQKIAPKVNFSSPESFLRLDLRGKRADLALEELERFLDRSLLAGTGGVEIIHGRGTGALRRAVHEKLRSFPGVASFETAPEGQGGDGVTRVLFR